jgi:hypothetical protein
VYEDKIDVEKQEELLAVIHHRGLAHIMKMLDESLELMRNDVLTVPLPQDPQSAAIAVYAKRCQAEGGMALKRALTTRIEKVVRLHKEAQNDRERTKA